MSVLQRKLFITPLTSVVCLQGPGALFTTLQLVGKACSCHVVESENTVFGCLVVSASTFVSVQLSSFVMLILPFQ